MEGPLHGKKRKAMGESNNSSRFGSVEPSSINGEKHSPEVIDNEQTVKKLKL